MLGNASPDVGLVGIAQDYLRSRPWLPGHWFFPAGAGPPPPRPDEQLGIDIAAAYDAAPQSGDQRTAELYKLLTRENLAQFEAVTAAGVKVLPWRKPGQPYADSADLRRSFHTTGTLRVFLTRHGHGDDGEAGSHPLRGRSTVEAAGIPFAHNDVFRAVHDIFGHCMFDNSFGVRGEFAAAYCHLLMYPPPLHPLLFTEQVAQICWFFYGPHLLDARGLPRRAGDPGYVAPRDRPYPPQKWALLDRELLDRYLTLFDSRENS
ncbi:hypothetical protein Ahu01nite_099260 [Winogradskya humida]|uniref:Uncharacterized protein n=2 Tax=Winogradskya humida TaxID=113566 RepID=A0ABQ4A7J4_9ACTN|nr:hypothetical protein Ahu01nite_099260 [Actinoplanes humidus]